MTMPKWQMYYVQIVFIIHKCILLLNAFFFFFHQMQYILWQYPPAMFYKITVQWSFATIIVLEQTSNQSWSLNPWSKAISQRNYFSRVFFFSFSLYFLSRQWEGAKQDRLRDAETRRLWGLSKTDCLSCGVHSGHVGCGAFYFSCAATFRK